MISAGLLLIPQLQRSRTRWSAERRRHGGSRHSIRHASTEPHSLECGEASECQSTGACAHASTEPHSLECGENASFLQTAESIVSFNGAALVGVRRAEHENLTLKQAMSFNGAALVGVRRAASSMPSLSQPWGFNGAALVGVRRGRRRRGLWCRLRGFNGAALVGVRRVLHIRRKHGGELASTEPHSLECGETSMSWTC